MAGTVRNRLRASFLDYFGTYSTPNQIKIRNTYVAVIYRLIQLVVAVYIALYIIWIKKGYQDIQEPHGSNYIKVKGVARVSTDQSNLTADTNKQLLWDAAEYLIPPIENGAFFIATRKTVTYNQTLSRCPSISKGVVSCNSSYNPCVNGTVVSDFFGFLTGDCVHNQKNARTYCEMNAWCPQELSESINYRINIDDLKDFTVFIKTIVTFLQYNIKIRTVKDHTKFSCRFNGATDRRCPIFTIGYILQHLRDQDNNVDLTALYNRGGLIEIQQTWNCDFDISGQEKECFPTFTFNLLQSGSDEMSPGINYRFVEKYNLHGREYRTLTKVYGLRFVLTIRGKGKRFDIAHLFIAIGSGVGFMVIAKIVCEFIFMHFHKYRKAYRQQKTRICHLSQSDASDSKEQTKITDVHGAQPLISPQTSNESSA